MPTKKKPSARTAARSTPARAPDVTATPTTARRSAFASAQPSEAFAHFQPQAAAVPTADLAPFTGQALVMRTNILTALGAMEPHWAAALTAYPTARLTEVFELPSLVLALDYAAQRVPVVKMSTGEIEAMLREGAPWRELALSYLEVVAHPLIGLVPRERVAAIRKGHGKLDSARDFVAIAGVFAEYATELAGKHPFTPAQLEHLATLGGALIEQLRPGNAVVEVRQRGPEFILRDQFAQLVTERYDHLMVLASVALGHARAAALLPALRSTAPVATRASGDGASEPAPAQPATATP